MTIFAIILTVVYFASGVPKLINAKPVVEQFEEFGLNRNTRYAVGIAEVAAAVGLFIDGLDTLAAIGMVLMMIGAIFFHRRAGHAVQDSIPAAVVLIASVAYAMLSI